MTCFNYPHEEPLAPAHHSFNKRHGMQWDTLTRTNSVFKQTNQCMATTEIFTCRDIQFTILFTEHVHRVHSSILNVFELQAKL